MKKLSSILLVGVLSLTGCVRHSPGLSYDSGVQQSRQATELAQAVAERISQRYPGQSVHVAKADAGVFGDALEYALTQTGSLGTESSALSLTYAMGEMDGSGYLHVRFSDGNSMAQSFPLAAPELAMNEALAPPIAQPASTSVETMPLSPAPEPSVSPVSPKPVPSVSPLPASAPLTPVAPVAAAPSIPPGTPTKPAPTSPVAGTPTRLATGVLSSLPPNWRYTIPDASRRSTRVNKPSKSSTWRESIQSMAEQAGCAASFDENARRVTIIAYDDAPLPQKSPSVPTATPKVAANAVPNIAPSAGPATSPTTLPMSGPNSPVVSSALAEVSTLPPATPTSHSPQGMASPSTVLPVTAMPPISPVAQKTAEPLAVVMSPPVSPAVAEEWMLAPGSLADQLNSWCAKAGWTLVWKADSDVRLHVNAVMRGTFEKAVGELFNGLSVQGNALRGTLYHGNNVLEVREN